MTSLCEEMVVEYTADGREIHQTADGEFLVQPWDDDCWIVCQSLEEARTVYQRPDD